MFLFLYPSIYFRTHHQSLPMDEIAHHHRHQSHQKRKQGHDDDSAPSSEPIAPASQDSQPTAARLSRHRPAASRDYHHDHSDSKRPRIDTELPVVQTPRVDVTPTATATAVSTPTSSTPTLASAPVTAPSSPLGAPPLRHYQSRLGRPFAKRRSTRPAASHAASSFVPYGHILPATDLVPLVIPEFKNSPYIPPSKPLINRTTLRELELDVILRNPVIRMYMHPFVHITPLH